MTAPNKHAELRKELSNPSIGSKDHVRKLALSLLDELEAEQGYREGALSRVTAGTINSERKRPNWKPQRSALQNWRRGQ